ncbi:MAG: hypothetical protein ACRELY_17785 [Polyangiaceae bacterium]
MSALEKWMAPETRSRRLVIGAGIYLVCLIVFAIVAGPARLLEHTPFNHYAHLAYAWLHGRQDLVNGPPSYAQGNDFAQFDGKTYISFPPFPALLMLPFVALAGSPENFRDGQFIISLAGIGPALLFLILEKLRRTERSARSEKENIALALLFAFGTVYFFTAVEGTVWFAAHVVGVACAGIYILCALDAERPFLAGLALACAWTTRPPMMFIALLFAMEAIRVSCKDGLPTEGTLQERIEETWKRADKKILWNKLLLFAAPFAASFLIASWMNESRFGDPSPLAFGHEYLSVAWHTRIAKWGLAGYHYLSKNLGVMLTVMPWLPPKGAHGAPALQINEHGLALWFTTPLYLWLLYPKKRGFLHDLVLACALMPMLVDLCYQNSGWRQFGYRFSNDYALLLFILLAVGDRPMKTAFKIAAIWGIVWNLFGAVTFDRGGQYDRYYWREGTQTILYQSD